MEFQNSLDYLYGLQRFGVKLGLANMQALQSRLAPLRDPVPCIHVAGTNGKGSVSVFLAEMLRHSGLRVGLYTSPHLHCFSERIRIDGQPVERSEIAALAGEIKQAAGEIPVTFFEATTAMALLAFKKHQVDVTVIETGLGGRLDATNILQPQLCLLTPISMDHSEHLGDKLSQIAREKAGIIKPGVPVVIGRQTQEVAALLLSAAADLKAPACLAGRDYQWEGDHNSLSVQVGGTGLEGLTCPLPGEHQLDNFAQAFAAATKLAEQGGKVSEGAIRLAGQTARWPGRLEWWGGQRRLLLDVAHNHAGMLSLAAYLISQKIMNAHLVVGLSGVRNPAEVLAPVKGLAKAIHVVPVDCGTSVPTGQTAAWATGQKIPVSEHLTAMEGLAAALAGCGQNEPVVVCGSLYLVAELRQKLIEAESSGAVFD